MDSAPEKYSFTTAPEWAESPSESTLVQQTQETDFSKNLMDENKDICFYLKKIRNHKTDGSEEYSCVVYSLTQPKTLEIASVEDIYLEENASVEFHKIGIIRNGVYIDKTADTKIKVLDSEDQSHGGVYNNSKKINISIRDLHLYDILVMERTHKVAYSSKEFIRKEFMKHIFITPEIYWGYVHYEFQLINNTPKNIVFQKFFFRDEQGKVIQSPQEILAPGEKFVWLKYNYENPVDASREIYPFIDFATQADWKSLSDFIFPLYDDVYKKSDLKEVIPELAQKIDEIESQDQKIKWAVEYAQNSIKYIFDSDEMNGHQPQEISVTYATKQGDCKAKSVFLKSLLDYIGVKADVVVVNYRSDFFIQYYSPSLLSFNHVIVKIEKDGKEYFIDPTSQEEYGTLENRNFLQFYHYLPVQPNQDLQKRPSHQYPKFCVEEVIDYHAKNEKGSIELQSTFRYHRANGIRNYFKNTNKREILDSWMNSLFYCLNFNNDRKIEDIRKIFQNPEINVVADDKNENEITVKFKADLEKPYFVDKDNKRYLMFWDHNTLKNAVKDFRSTDSSFWHGFDSEKYTLNLSTDHQIDTDEKYTKQENTINNKYFTHKIRKSINKNGGTAYIEYQPVVNLEVPVRDMQKLKEDYLKIEDSNFGFGIDIIEPGVTNFLKNKISKWFK